INTAVFVGKESDESIEEPTVVQQQVEEKPAPQEEKDYYSDEASKEREKRIEELAKTDPRLYFFVAVLNLFILFVIFMGLLLDGYFLGRWLRRKPLDIGTNRPESAKWTVADVVRVTLIFLSFGYVFVILQAMIARWIPILKNENFRMVFDTAMMNVVGISVIFYFIVKKYRQSINAIGLTLKGFAKNVFYAMIGYVTLVPILLGIMLVTYFVIKWFAYEPPVQPIVEIFMKEKEPTILLMSTLFAAIFGPIAEEIFFRGFMYGAIKKTFGIFWAMIITSAVFSILHTHVVGFLPIMMLGLLLAFLYEKTGSLISCMSVHIAHNIGMVILVFLARSIGT
ncbi:MAG: CPBP family intramembrane glutamic endopeptidase, partial [Candidatus Omnitrophota bacterium]